MAWTHEQTAEAIASRQKLLAETEALPEGTVVVCPWSPLPHPDYCMCGGSGEMTREERIADLICDIEILMK